MNAPYYSAAVSRGSISEVLKSKSADLQPNGLRYPSRSTLMRAGGRCFHWAKLDLQTLGQQSLFL